MDAQLRVSESTRNQEATLCLFLFFIQLLLACNPQSTTKTWTCQGRQKAMDCLWG